MEQCVPLHCTHTHVWARRGHHCRAPLQNPSGGGASWGLAIPREADNFRGDLLAGLGLTTIHHSICKHLRVGHRLGLCCDHSQRAFLSVFWRKRKQSEGFQKEGWWGIF